MQRQPILTERDLSLFQLRTRYVRNYLTFAGTARIFCSICPAPACMIRRRWTWS